MNAFGKNYLQEAGNNIKKAGCTVKILSLLNFLQIYPYVIMLIVLAFY